VLGSLSRPMQDRALHVTPLRANLSWHFVQSVLPYSLRQSRPLAAYPALIRCHWQVEPANRSKRHSDTQPSGILARTHLYPGSGYRCEHALRVLVLRSLFYDAHQRVYQRLCFHVLCTHDSIQVQFSHSCSPMPSPSPSPQDSSSFNISVYAQVSTK
jgi:hypothetical protein